jgi:hypothetical protein
VKKAIIFLLALIAVTSVFAGETKYSMELWNRWTMTSVDGETVENSMSVERGYFRIEPKFTGKIKGRFNVDFFSSDKDSDANGAGIKLKYAYIDWAEMLPIKDSKVQMGLIKNYFGTIYDWSYVTIEKDPSDKYKFTSSTDYGVALAGYLPNAFGEYAVAIVNGEGYKKAGDNVNTDFGYLANIRVNPIVGLTLGGSVKIDSKYNDDDMDDNDTPDDSSDDYKKREDYTKMALVGRYAFGSLDIQGQYLTQTTAYEKSGKDDKTATALMVMPVFKLKNYIGKDLDLVARYDMYDPNTDVDDDGKNLMLFGLNYHVLRDSKNKPQLWAQFNYSMTTYEDDNKDDINTMMLQLRWKFSNKLK